MYETWEIFWDVVAFSNSRTEFQFTSFLWRLLCFEWRIKVFPSGFFFFSPLVPFIIIVTYPRSSKLKNLRWNTSNSGPYNYILFTLFENHPKCRILAFSINFCTIKIELSGNTVWPQASGFQKLVKIDHFWPFFYWTFVHSKCKRSSLRCWTRLFLWFSNTVIIFGVQGTMIKLIVMLF